MSPPPLDETKWSAYMRDFLRICLVKDPWLRPSTDELLSHPFITDNNTEGERVRARDAFLDILLPFRAEKAAEVQPETLLTVPSSNREEDMHIGKKGRSLTYIEKKHKVLK